MRLLTTLAATLLCTGAASAACDAGIDWTVAGEIQDGSWQAITHGGGVFVAVGADGRIMTSPDGNIWTAREAPGGGDWYDVTYGNGLFAAVAWDDRAGVMTSPDGVDWTRHELRSDHGFGTVAYGDGTFVAIGAGYLSTARSSGGENWEIVESIPRPQMRGGSGSLTWADDRFTYITAGTVYSSPDGVEWTMGMNGDLAGHWYDLAYGNGRYVAFASDGTWRLTTSTDGENWTGAPGEVAGQIKFFDGQFINGGTRFSSDGVSWWSDPEQPDYSITSLTYDGERYVGVGDNFAATGLCRE